MRQRLIIRQEPLEDRVDKAGQQQLSDADAARKSRARGRVEAAQSDGDDPDPEDVAEAAR